MNKQNPNRVFRLAVMAVIAAAYAALTIVLAPISYGPVQFRVSEALTALPFLMPGTVWGIAIIFALTAQMIPTRAPRPSAMYTGKSVPAL